MKRILVIDDEQQYRSTLSSILQLSGYDVMEAAGGREAIDIIQSDPPDLIVSDVMMDTLDGYGLIERLRMDPVSTTIPFIFMSALSDRGSLRKGMNLGADDFLVKPFTGTELLSAVETRLNKRAEAIAEGGKVHCK